MGSLSPLVVAGDLGVDLRAELAVVGDRRLDRPGGDGEVRGRLVDVGDEETAKAVAAYAFSMAAARRPSRRQRARAIAELARSLATDERRRAVRAALAELAELSAEEFPLASLALRELLAEPVPEDPVKDQLWVNLVVGLADEQLEDALADETVA